MEIHLIVQPSRVGCELQRTERAFRTIKHTPEVHKAHFGYHFDSMLFECREKQQLALDRALMLNPKILLLDEPSLDLSPKLVTDSFDLIKSLQKEFQMAILIVEQKVREVLKIADRVVALRLGQVVFEGTPTALQEGDALKRIFLL